MAKNLPASMQPGPPLCPRPFDFAQGDMVGAQGDMVGAQGDMVGAQGDMVGAQGDMVVTRGDMVDSQGDFVADGNCVWRGHVTRRRRIYLSLWCWLLLRPIGRARA